MEDVIVTVLKAFPYAGRDLRPGDLVTMDRMDALLAQRYGLVGLTLPQTYLTRDLIAQ